MAKHENEELYNMIKQRQEQNRLAMERKKEDQAAQQRRIEYSTNQQSVKQANQPNPKRKNPFRKKLWFWVASVAIAVLIYPIFSGVQGGDTHEKSEQGQESAENKTEVKESTEPIKVMFSAERTTDDKPHAEDTTNHTQSGISYEVTDTYFYRWTNSIGTNRYFAYIEITNTGKNCIYLYKCTFDLEDNNGHLLQSDDLVSSCPDVIAPGEKGYFYSDLLSSYIDDGVPVANGVVLAPQYDLKEADKKPIEYHVSDTALREGTYGAPKITGRVKNTSGKDDSYFYIQVILYDKSGKIIGITGTSITDFYAGKTASFEISCVDMPDNVTFASVGNYEVIARATHYQW